jgi:hypothetical protein
LRIIEGPKTRLRGVNKVAVDPMNDEVVVSLSGGGGILVFSRKDEGDVAPLRSIEPGPLSGLRTPWNMYLDPVNDEIGVGDMHNNDLKVFPRKFDEEPEHRARLGRSARD